MIGPRLLTIDDDRAILDVVSDVGKRAGYEVRTVQNPKDALKEIARYNPSLILVDLVMPGMDGVELLRAMSLLGCKPRIIVVSSCGQKTLAAAIRAGREYGLEMTASLAKPFAPQSLESLLLRTRTLLFDVGPEDLIAALRDRHLEVMYQPKINLQERTPTIVGAEALVRWHHADRGTISASRFIPMAERAGLIEPLSVWVLSEVIQQMKLWAGRGRHFNIAVNIPAGSLQDLEFPARIERALAAADISAPRLTLEVTEREPIQKGPTAIDVLTRLRLKGFGLSMDDFGVGYSSLSDLYKLPFTELKIDALFTRDLPTSAEARTIVRAIIKLAHELGVETCAEGVETQSMADILRAFGCQNAQGFLYGSAEPAAVFEALCGRPRPVVAASAATARAAAM